MNIPASQFIAHLLPLATQTIYLVGGSVRDLLIGDQEIKDVDLLMAAGSEDVARAFADAIDGSFFFLDEERKITRVVKRTEQDSFQFDFTNYEGADLNADLGRRDFTINAMAVDLRKFIEKKSLSGLIDLFNGWEDVQKRLIRTTKPEVLDEDPLRLLRAVRFAAALGFSIDSATAEHIRLRASLLSSASPERVREELFLILSESNAEQHLNLMDSLGLLDPLFPELMPLRGFAPGQYHVHDVFTHSVKTAGCLDSFLAGLDTADFSHASAVREHLNGSLEHGISRRAALRFACLLHDIGKPETYSRDEEGHIHFYNHDNLGAEKAKEICRRLRLSRDTEALVAKVIKNHMRLFNLSTPGGPSRNALFRYCRDLGDAVPESLLLAQADARATSEIMPKEKFTDTGQTSGIVLDYYYSKYLKAKAKPLVTGEDLIKLGFKPGPRFSEILDQVREQQAAGALKNRQEALDSLRQMQ